MSNKLISAAWKTKGLNPGQKVVLLYMADVAREPECVCFARHDTIAAACGMSERYVGLCLPKLEAAGHISFASGKRRASKDDPRTSWRVHPGATPEGSSGVTPELCDTDTRTPTQPHPNSTTLTPELCATPNKCTPVLTQSIPKGEPTPKLSGVEKVILDRELTRIETRLKELADANLQWALEEKTELRRHRNELRAKLGLPAVSNRDFKRPNPHDRNAGTLNAGRSSDFANIG